MYKDFSAWSVYDGNSFGSGTSWQEWIVNDKTGELALFKQRKADDTTDNFSEKIASEIAEKIGLPCARVELAIRNGRKGIVSYKINNETEIILEGIQFISSIYNSYDVYRLVDESTKEKYSLNMILKSINELNLKRDLFKIFIFDFLIGNTDRHHSNWAIIINSYDIRVCPVYDNASSLCAYIKDEHIKNSFNDKVWLNAIIDSKSKSAIKLNEKSVRHSEFVQYLKNNYYLDTVGFVKNIIQNLTDTVIDDILNTYNGVLSDLKIKLLKIYLKEKVKKLSNIYGIITN